MIGLMLLTALLGAATVAGLCALIYVLFTVNARRFNTVVATDILDDWQLHLELLDPEGRERALMAPPVVVLDAMAALPSRGGIRGMLAR